MQRETILASILVFKFLVLPQNEKGLAYILHLWRPYHSLHQKPETSNLLTTFFFQ